MTSDAIIDGHHRWLLWHGVEKWGSVWPLLYHGAGWGKRKGFFGSFLVFAVGGNSMTTKVLLPVGTNDLSKQNLASLIAGEQVEFTRQSNEIRIDGKDIDRQLLLENETIVSFGTWSFFIIKREKAFAIRLKNTANPSIARFNGVSFYP